MKNTPDYSDYLKLLTQKDLIEEALGRFLMAHDELIQRDDAVTEFLRTLCSLTTDTWIWFTLWEAGGAYRFSELLSQADCSDSTLKRKILNLRVHGLVRQVNGLYSAVSPAWLIPKRVLEAEK